VQLLLAGVALLACAAAAWLAFLHRHTTRRLGEQLRAVTARLERAEPARPPAQQDLAGGLAGLGAAADAALCRLAEAEERATALEAVLDAVPLGVIVTGPAGRELLRNHRADDLVGTRPADALASGAVAELMAVAGGGDTETRPLELSGPPRRTLSLTAVPLAGGAAAVVVEDVSDRRRLDAVRRDFVANVSHELKTPVAALGLLAEALVSEDDLGVVRRLGGRIQDEAFRVNRVIDDLLDLSRIEGEATSGHAPVPVDAVVAEAVEHVRPAADFRGISIVAGEVPRSWSILGERRQLVSALVNLLENAVKYSDDGGDVSLRARTDGATIALEVEDRGVGIPSRELDRIFERFYRVDRGRGRATGGTGLGLSIVRHVAANHGGDVRVRSVEGEGSVFTLLLPAQPRPMELGALASEAG
jgi:two-component system sensor histidine kinase SenX3